MALLLPTRYVAVETSIGIVINATVTTVPILLWQTGGAVQPPHTAAVSLAPQIMMGAIMSATAPALLTRWRQKTGRIDSRFLGARPSLPRTALTALALALAFTVIVLAVIHLLLPSIVGDSMGWLTRLAVSGTQGVLAAALLTPLALAMLFGGRPGKR